MAYAGAAVFYPPKTGLPTVKKGYICRLNTPY